MHLIDCCPGKLSISAGLDDDRDEEAQNGAKVKALPVLEAFDATRHANAIQSLPNELLYHIFSLLFRSTPVEAIHHQIYRASAVCKSWNALIKRTPRFWTRLPKLGMSLSATEAFSGSEEQGQLEAYNKRAALPSHVNSEGPSLFCECEETRKPIVWECVCGDGKCQQAAIETLDDESSEEVSVEGEHGPPMFDGHKPFQTMFHGYLHALLKFLIRSYPLPVEAHLCLPPREVFSCVDCGGYEDAMMYTFVHVLKRARTLSIDIHTSSAHYPESFMSPEASINSENFPLAVVNGVQDLPWNLARSLPAPPVDGRSTQYSYLQDLTVILSHSAIPAKDDHSRYSTLAPVFSQAKLSRLSLVDTVHYIPEGLPERDFPLYTNLFCKADWGTLTVFESVFHGMGDVRVVLEFARDLKHAVFTLQLDDEQDVFPIPERILMHDSILAGRARNPLLDTNIIYMSSLRTLQINLTQHSFHPLHDPMWPETISPPLDESPVEGPGRALFQYILAGVQVPSLEKLILSAAFFQLNCIHLTPSVDARNSMHSFFQSCQSSLRHLELEILPDSMQARRPIQAYTIGSRIPIFYQHLFEAIRHLTATATTTSALESIVVNQPVPTVQVSKDVFYIINGRDSFTDMDGVTSKLAMPLSLKTTRMAFDRE